MLLYLLHYEHYYGFSVILSRVVTRKESLQ